jgi:hypothetical protein
METPEETPAGEVVADDPGELVTPRSGNLLLAIVAAVGVAAIGVALWGVLYATAKREFVGVSVLIGLLVGYVVRELSKRSTIATRLLAVVVTALACVAGTVVGEVAYTAAQFHTKFWKLFGDVAGDWFTLLRHRTGLQFAIYAAALVIAFLAAGPTATKRSAPVPPPPPGFDPVGGEAGDPGDPGETGTAPEAPEAQAP